MTATHCSHHWVIEAAAGPLSKGKCRLCGEERKFSNSAVTRGGWTVRSKESFDRSGGVDAKLGMKDGIR